MLISLTAGFRLGVLLERLVLSRLNDTPGDSTLLATLGLGLVLSNTLFLIFGAEPESIYLPYATTSGTHGGVRLPIAQVYAAGATIGVMVLLYFFPDRTQLRLAIRATVQNRSDAERVGMCTHRIRAL